MPVRVEAGVDAGLAWHFGNPVAEARRLEAGDGVVDLRNREVVEVSGADRLSWLHSLTTQHMEALAPGEATTALILSPTGHIEHVMRGGNAEALEGLVRKASDARGDWQMNAQKQSGERS